MQLRHRRHRRQPTAGAGPRQSEFGAAHWRQAMAQWQAAADAERAATVAAQPRLRGNAPDGWWQAAFADRVNPSEARGHRCGERQMLTIVAYDITAPKRLALVARHCADYGVRVQYSVFECRMEADAFDRFWQGLQALIDPEEDRLVAYKICADCAKSIYAAGTMVSNEQVVAYVF